jgi:hypothetical protein
VTAIQLRARKITAFAIGAWLGLAIVGGAFGLGVATGMVLHRLNELQHGGCAALYGDHS